MTSPTRTVRVNYWSACTLIGDDAAAAIWEAADADQEELLDIEAPVKQSEAAERRLRGHRFRCGKRVLCVCQREEGQGRRRSAGESARDRRLAATPQTQKAATREGDGFVVSVF